MKAETLPFTDDGDVPNNRLPLILYRAAVPAKGDVASAFEALFHGNGWGQGWRYTVFPFHHYHSNVHETLGVAKGEAEIRFGGEAGGKTVKVSAGDAVLIPAGVGHKRISSSNDFLVVGAYALGAPSADLYREGAEDKERIRARIAKVPLPPSDPVGGKDGPAITLWK
jgi:uncharacterized protein YjlB